MFSIRPISTSLAGRADRGWMLYPQPPQASAAIEMKIMLNRIPCIFFIFICSLTCHDIHKLALDHDHLPYSLLPYIFHSLPVTKREILNLVFGKAYGNHQLPSNFSVDLDDEFHLLVLCEFLFPCRPPLPRNERLVSDSFPELFGNMRSKRGGEEV